MTDLRNATDVRHAAAEALGKLASAADREELSRLAEDYPEHSVRLALLRSCRQITQAASGAFAQDTPHRAAAQ